VADRNAYGRFLGRTARLPILTRSAAARSARQSEPLAGLLQGDQFVLKAFGHCAVIAPFAEARHDFGDPGGSPPMVLFAFAIETGARNAGPFIGRHRSSSGRCETVDAQKS